jgi:dTDP-4-amino-4,6-dideoxygalactose transaminase
MIPAAAPSIGRKERKAVDRVMRSGMLAQGPEVAAFEKEFSSVVNGRECVALNSGTSALHMAFVAAGIKSGDEVIVPSFSFAATANAVALTGATPVFVDIEPDYFTLNPALVEAAITKKTKAIMPVHLYGHPADMVTINAIAQKYDLLVFEDAAQAHAASINGIPVGAWSEAASFSFYPTKNMTSGEGGMVATSNPSLARAVRVLRNQGMEKRYENEVVGFNTRMTDIHAAIGRVQLTQLAGWTTARQENAVFLNTHLSGVVTPKTAEGMTHVFHQYTVRIPAGERDAFAAELTKRGIGNGVYYPTPIHELPSFRLKLKLPETSLAALEALSLPVHPALKRRDLEKIVSTVNAIAKAGS